MPKIGLSYVLTIFLSLILCLPAYPEIHIWKEWRVLNDTPPGYCVWACLEMIGNVEKIPQFSGLMALYIKQPYVRVFDDVIIKQLDASKVSYAFKSTDTSTTDISFVTKYTEMDLPVLVGIRNWPYARGLHAVLIIKVADDKVTIVDPNDSEKKWLYYWDVATFKSNWNGLAVAVFKPK